MVQIIGTCILNVLYSVPEGSHEAIRKPRVPRREADPRPGVFERRTPAYRDCAKDRRRSAECPALEYMLFEREVFRSEEPVVDEEFEPMTPNALLRHLKQVVEMEMKFEEFSKWYRGPERLANQLRTFRDELATRGVLVEEIPFGHQKKWWVKRKQEEAGEAETPESSAERKLGGMPIDKLEQEIVASLELPKNKDGSDDLVALEAVAKAELEKEWGKDWPGVLSAGSFGSSSSSGWGKRSSR